MIRYDISPALVIHIDGIDFVDFQSMGIIGKRIYWELVFNHADHFSRIESHRNRADFWDVVRHIAKSELRKLRGQNMPSTYHQPLSESA